MRKLLIIICFLPLLSCESDNEHFCARYKYVYDQLLDDDLPSYSEMKQQLMEDIANPKKDKQQAKFMLFVLDDWYSEFKPQHEDSKAFCMRINRWKQYQ